MQLTTFTDYTLRVLIYVGAKGEGLATISEIADCFGISKAHLMKVVYELGHAGLLETVRGKHGGIRLLRRPANIRVGDVVRSTENNLSAVACLSPNGTDCRIEGVCVLKGAMRGAAEVFIAHLNQFTLADLLRPRAGLRRAIGLGDSERGLSKRLSLNPPKRKA